MPKPVYREKKDYGKTPNYLQKRMTDRAHEQAKAMEEAKRQKEKEEFLKKGLIPLPEEERQRLLTGLKQNWDKLNSDYQRLSLTVDTIPKINR